jgi:Ca2+-binding EF-hand superfamily protein
MTPRDESQQQKLGVLNNSAKFSSVSDAQFSSTMRSLSTNSLKAREGGSFSKAKDVGSPTKRHSDSASKAGEGSSPSKAKDGGSPSKPKLSALRAGGVETQVQREKDSVMLLKGETASPWQVADAGMNLNAMKLVAGASNSGAVHRDLGGGTLTFVHEEVPKHRHAHHVAKNAAHSVAYLVQAMQGPAKTSESLTRAAAMQDTTAKQDRKHRARSEAGDSTRDALSRSPSKHMTLEQKKHAEMQAKENAVKKASKDAHFEESTFSLRQFRTRILERFSSVMEAFNIVDCDASKKLTLKEWNCVLFASGLANYREARLLFEVMDADRDGSLTMLEFHVGLEAIAPVTSLEAFRKRLLCVGFTSMYQAVTVMDGGGDDTTSRQLNFLEFSDCMRRVFISEPMEHRAIFELVRSDPGLRRTDVKISLADLASALAAVSPCLLLEDLRSRLMKRHVSISHAWHALSDDEALGHAFGIECFTKHATERLGLSPTEASKAFRLIDIDDSGEISHVEFVSAMSVSQPSLIYEDLRHKIRQRYLSIDVAFRDAFETLDGEELDDEKGLGAEEFADILEKLEMSRKCTMRLFGIIDGSLRHELTLCEFFKGVRLFAPSSMLEGIRLQLLQSSYSIADAVCSVVSDRTLRMDRNTFGSVLGKLQVHCDESHIDLMFDFLDVRDVGLVTVSEMIAALQNVQPGGREQVDPGLREERAEHFIKAELAPFHKTVTDLKRRIKQDEETKQPHRKTDDEQHNRLPRIVRRAKSVPAGHAAAPSTEKHGEGDPVRLPEAGVEGSRLLSAGGPPRSATAQGPRSTFYKLHSRFKQLPAEATPNALHGTMSQLKGYFNSAHSTLQDHRPVLAMSYTWTDLHRSTEELKCALDPQLVEFRKASDAARI